jgi:hypothetical protein
VTRPLLPRGRSLLYHGSRSPAQILHDNALLVPDVGIPAVSFSRLLHVGIHFATTEREKEEVGAMFVLDRDRLAQTYKLEPFRDGFWDDCPERQAQKSSEAEEQVRHRDVVGLNQFLVDVIWFSPDGSLQSTVERRTEPLSACSRHPSLPNLSTASRARLSRRQTLKRIVANLCRTPCEGNQASRGRIPVLQSPIIRRVEPSVESLGCEEFN